jgi:anti-sigma B factor antagonist
MAFGISAERAGLGVQVITPEGKLDLHSASSFEDALGRAIEEGAAEIVADLSRTTFIDSTALGALARGAQRLRTVGGRLLVVCADESITKLFLITGLDRAFSIYASRTAALAVLGVA